MSFRKDNEHHPWFPIGLFGYFFCVYRATSYKLSLANFSRVSHTDPLEPAKFNIQLCSLLLTGSGRKARVIHMAVKKTVGTEDPTFAPFLCLFHAISLNSCINKCFTHTHTSSFAEEQKSLHLCLILWFEGKGVKWLKNSAVR